MPCRRSSRRPPAKIARRWNRWPAGWTRSKGKTSTLEGKASALDSTWRDRRGTAGRYGAPAACTALVIAVGQLRSALAADKYTAGSPRCTICSRLIPDLMAHFAPTLDRLQPIARSAHLRSPNSSLPTTEIARAAETEASGATLGVEEGWGQRLLRQLSG